MESGAHHDQRFGVGLQRAEPAGFDNSQGILSAAYLKDPNDPQWKDDKGLADWRAFMTRWYPEGDQADAATVYGLVQILKQCGDDLTRANVMKQAANLDMDIAVYLPGMKVQDRPDRLHSNGPAADDAVQG